MKEHLKKLEILKALSDGSFHSGEDLGDDIGVSRAAISKHIKGIQEWGLSIYRIQGKGYALSSPLELLSVDQVICKDLPQTSILGVVDSTNQFLLDQMTVLKKGQSCFAEYQVAGRGRRGRTWVSPFGSNIYCSIFWRFDNGLAATMGLSLAIGIAVVDALEVIGCKGLKLKWPNDIYWNELKLAGVLIELSGQSGGSADVVIGIGINIELNEKSALVIDQPWVDLMTILGERNIRNKLASELLVSLNKTLLEFEHSGLQSFINRWKKLDNFIDESITLTMGSQSIHGVCRGINSQGAILLERNCIVESYFGGEISVRKA